MLGSVLGTVLFMKEQSVHNNALLPTEAKVLINELNTESMSTDNAKHPTYGYDLEVGSFAAWPLEELVYPIVKVSCMEDKAKLTNRRCIAPHYTNGLNRDWTLSLSVQGQLSVPNLISITSIIACMHVGVR